ncbi:MAG: hypothetical protein ABIS50_01910 [Luteolibacter sp.]
MLTGLGETDAVTQDFLATIHSVSAGVRMKAFDLTIYRSRGASNPAL